MLLSALILTATIQEPLVLKFSPVGETVYREQFAISETTDGQSPVTASGERRLRIKVREVSRARARMELTPSDLEVRGPEGLAAELRGWLDQPIREQFVNERGFVERTGEPRGNRPFFGVVLPPPAASIPDRWNAKLLLPIGSERLVDFKYELEQVEQREEPVLRIRVQASDRQGSLSTSLNGVVFVARSGSVLNGEIITRLEDTSTKTETAITYRFQKQ